MKIKWIAHSCFHITLSNGKVLLFDPFGEGIGYEIVTDRGDCKLPENKTGTAEKGNKNETKQKGNE